LCCLILFGMSQRECRLDVCPECKVREGDGSEKELYQCKYCERWFCERHLGPRLAVMKDLKATIKDKTWRNMVEEDWKREDGHPDYAYTWEKLNELRIEKEVLQAKISAFLDRSRVYRKPIPIKPEKKRPLDSTKGESLICPKCGSKRTMSTAYREEFESFQCLSCQYTWKEWKSDEIKPPEAYAKPMSVETEKEEKSYFVKEESIDAERFDAEKRRARKRKSAKTLATGLMVGGVLTLLGLGIIFWEIYNPLFWTIIFIWFIPIPLVLIGGFLVLLGVVVAIGSIADFVGSLPPIKKIVAVLLIVMILGIALWNAPSILSTFQKITGLQSSSTYSHEALTNYALFLINTDRTTQGVSNVSLSPIDSGQRHAENMLANHFFSHWDTNGYKPYMRYTLAGGKGSVAENVAWQYSNGPFDAKEAIRSLEWQMMYNDSDWDWGHRDNILSPFHNKVSIGIAYDNNNLYFVQDFEDDYIDWSMLSVSQSGEVRMSGTFRKGELSAGWVNIFYDSLPSNLTSEQLKKPAYSGGYTQGTFVGMVVPSGYESPEGITITAQTWTQTGRTFQIKFDLSPAFNVHGKGVYTLYLQPDPKITDDSLTSYSVWRR